MELNAFTILQIAVFIAVGYHANTHTTVAGSDEDIEVSYCGMNCTVESGKSSKCSPDCVCVHEGNERDGICISITYLGDLGNPLEDPSIDLATPLAPVFQSSK
uniref:Putative basic tail protein n=1 Tax=Ixodes ricinus TaxID=34613 RepID=A0A0K8R5N3_IXORI